MLSVAAEPKSGETFTLTSQYVFNCTYSGLNQFSGGFAGTKIGLKHEVTELALIEVPEILKEKGVTVMDGPFFQLCLFLLADYTLCPMFVTHHTLAGRMRNVCIPTKSLTNTIAQLELTEWFEIWPDIYPCFLTRSI